MFRNLLNIIHQISTYHKNVNRMYFKSFDLKLNACKVPPLTILNDNKNSSNKSFVQTKLEQLI